MKWIFVLLFLAPFIFAYPDSRFRFFRNDYNFYNEVDGWMKLHRVPANWTDARLRCQFEGSILASPLNVKMLQAMHMEITARQNVKVFTGVSAEFSAGDFFTVDGISLNKMPVQWAKNEPNNRDNKERCTILDNGGLADVPCEDTYSFICYKGMSQTIASPGICGTTDPDYTFDSRTSHCYKFHRFGRVWSRAFEVCSAEGGFLAIINSDKEADVLRELCDKNPSSNVIASTDQKDSVLLGYYKKHMLVTASSSFWTIQGQTLAEAGFEKWATWEPNNANSRQFCAGINRYAQLDDLYCDVPTAFICEKLPRSLLDDRDRDRGRYDGESLDIFDRAAEEEELIEIPVATT